MALKKTMTLVNNFGENTVFPGAYIKVDVSTAGKTRTSATVHVCEAAGGRVLKRSHYEFDTDLNGPNSIKQAYQYLKTLPEFAGAEDV